jgi:predicted neutral ceramidase superfamily lipid hydrolase
MLRLVFILELMTILSGLLFLRKGRPGSLYLILVAIILATLNENIIIHHSNHWWNISRNVFYNIFSLIDITLWTIVFFRIFSENKLMQKVVIIGSISILLYSLLEIFYIRSPNELHTDSLISWSAFVVVLCLVYFSDILLALRRGNLF